MSDRIRSDYRQAAAGFGATVGSLPADSWTQPGLGVWNVRELVGHTSRALLTVESYLSPTENTADPDLSDAAAYFGAARQAAATEKALADPDAVTERGRRAADALGADPAAAVADLIDRVLTLVDGRPDDALVHTPAGTMTLLGYLPTRTFELVVHGHDLCEATGIAVPAELTAAVPGCLHLAADLAAGRRSAAAVLLALTGRRALPDAYSVL